jgi:hypothetical protein
MDDPSFCIPGSGWVPDLPPPERPANKWLAVLIPKRDCTPFDREAVGLTLRDWQLTDPRAGHVWGLDDLLAGRRPRTPPILPLSYRCSPDAHEPVALVCMADDAPAPETFLALEAALGDLKDRVVLMDWGEYCLWQR